MEISAQGVSVTIGDREILRNESVSCRSGSMTALVGPSGSGKTTLLHCLGLLQDWGKGRVDVNGIDAAGWSASRRRRFWRDNAAFVLQDYGVIDDESVAFNVAMTSRVLRSQDRAKTARLDEALSATGLLGREAEPAAHLSGGEKQRLALARAIYKQADVILVDEPTASLDDGNRSRVIDLLTARARGGCTVIVATHDHAVIDACDSHHRVGIATRPQDQQTRMENRHEHAG